MASWDTLSLYVMRGRAAEHAVHTASTGRLGSHMTSCEPGRRGGKDRYRMRTVLVSVPLLVHTEIKHIYTVYYCPCIQE